MSKNEEPKEFYGLGASYAYFDIKPNTPSSPSKINTPTPQMINKIEVIISQEPEDSAFKDIPTRSTRRVDSLGKEPIPRPRSLPLLARRSNLEVIEEEEEEDKVNEHNEEKVAEDFRARTLSQATKSSVVSSSGLDSRNSIQSKRLNDQLLLMEMKLLDALEKSDLEKSLALPSIAEEPKPDEPVKKQPDFDKNLQRKKKNSIIAGSALLSLLIGAVIILSLVFGLSDCNFAGCKADAMYASLYSKLPKENNTIILRAANFKDFTQVQKFLQFVASTTPEQNATGIQVVGNLTSVSDGFVLLNASVIKPSNYAKILGTSSESFVPSDLPRLNFLKNLSNGYIDGKRQEVGPVVCGRLSPATPVLGLVPVFYESVYLDLSPDQVDISDYMNTSMTTNDIQNYDQFFNLTTKDGPNGSPYLYRHMPECCVEFMSGNTPNGRTRPDQVFPRMICEAGYIAGGKWIGWDSIRTPSKIPDSWLENLVTGSASDTLSSNLEDSILLLSSVDDVSWPKGLIFASGAAIPANTLPGLSRFFTDVKNIYGLVVNTSMSAFWPLKNDYDFNWAQSSHSFIFEDSDISFSNFLPSLFVAVPSVKFKPQILVSGTDLTPSYLMKFNYKDENSILFESNGCPTGYDLVNGNDVCQKSGYGIKLKSDSRLSSTSDLFLPPGSKEDKIVGIATFTAELEGSSGLCKARFDPLIVRVYFKLPSFPSNLTTGKNLLQDHFRFYYLTESFDGAAFQGNATQLRLSKKYGDNAYGGQWRQFNFVKSDLSVGSDWSNVESFIDVKTSARSQKVVVAIQPDMSSWELFRNLEVGAKVLNFSSQPVNVSFYDYEQDPFSEMSTPPLHDFDYWKLVKTSYLRLFDLSYDLLVESITKSQLVANGSKTYDYNIFGNSFGKVLEKNNLKKTEPLLVDSILFSGRVPSQFPFEIESLRPNAISLFSYPPSVGDVLPPAYTKVWYENPDNLLNDTDLTSIQETAIPIVKSLLNQLNMNGPGDVKSRKEMITGIAKQVESTLYSNSGIINSVDLSLFIQMLQNVCYSIYQDHELRKNVTTWLGNTLQWFKRWGMRYDKVQKDEVPQIFFDLKDFLWSVHKESLRVDPSAQEVKNIEESSLKDWTPFSLIAAISAQEFTISTNLLVLDKYYYNGNERRATASLLSEEILNGSYVSDFDSRVYRKDGFDYGWSQLGINSNDFSFNPNGGDLELESRKSKMLSGILSKNISSGIYCETSYHFCGTLNATRAFIRATLSEATKNTLEHLINHNPVPDQFPFEVMLPFVYLRTRTDVPFMSDSMDRWMESKKIRRSMWMTSATFEILSQTLKYSINQNNFDQMMFLKPCLELVNLKYFKANESISSLDFAILKVVDLVNKGSNESDIVDALLRVALLS